MIFFPLKNSLTHDTHSSKSVRALLLLNVLSLYKIWGKGWHFLEKAFTIQTSAHSSNGHLCNSLLHKPIKFPAIINSVNLIKKEQKLSGNLDKNPPKKVWSETITFLTDGAARKTPSKLLKILNYNRPQQRAHKESCVGLAGQRMVVVTPRSWAWSQYGSSIEELDLMTLEGPFHPGTSYYSRITCLLEQ